MEAYASLEPLLRYDVREAVHGDSDTSVAEEEQPGDYEREAVGCGLGYWCIDEVRTSGLWGAE
jgi:hypothetical protein